MLIIKIDNVRNFKLDFIFMAGEKKDFKYFISCYNSLKFFKKSI